MSTPDIDINIVSMSAVDKNIQIFKAKILNYNLYRVMGERKLLPTRLCN
jgi:hypothetical protein